MENAITIKEAIKMLQEQLDEGLAQQDDILEVEFEGEYYPVVFINNDSDTDDEGQEIKWIWLEVGNQI